MNTTLQLICSNRSTCRPEPTASSNLLCFIDFESGDIVQRDFGEFKIAGATSWSKGTVIDGGPCMIVSSSHYKQPIGPDVPFYKTVSVKSWIYDGSKHSLSTIDVVGDTTYEYVSGVTVVPGRRRLIACLFRDLDIELVSANYEGGDRVDIPKPVSGFCHGPSISSDETRMATEFTVSGEGTRIFVMNLDGSNPVQFDTVAGENQFMPKWSPDGEWISYVEYNHDDDPGHNTATLWVARPDGTESKQLTDDRSFWLSAVHGGPDTYGFGSNYPVWSPDGKAILYPRMLPGSRAAWTYNPKPEIDDHFGRTYEPGVAVGGAELCLVDIDSRRETVLVSEAPACWFFRASYAPDGKTFAYCRSTVGEPAELWVADSSGGERRFVTRGFDDLGVDHPAWIRC